MAHKIWLLTDRLRKVFHRSTTSGEGAEIVFPFIKLATEFVVREWNGVRLRVGDWSLNLGLENGWKFWEIWVLDLESCSNLTLRSIGLITFWVFNIGRIKREPISFWILAASLLAHSKFNIKTNKSPQQSPEIVNPVLELSNFQPSSSTRWNVSANIRHPSSRQRAMNELRELWGAWVDV